MRSGDDVRINDVRVGQVGEITLVDGKPVVELRFDGHRSIYRNATAVTASVGARSALGQKYVAFNPGSPQAGAVDPGEVIPASETTGAQELSDLLAVLDEPTRKALGSTLRETGGGVAGHTQDLRDTLAALPTELPDLATVSRALTTEGVPTLSRHCRPWIASAAASRAGSSNSATLCASSTPPYARSPSTTPGRCPTR
ncbi:MlaD family protein [Prauserella oleivorans]